MTTTITRAISPLGVLVMASDPNAQLLEESTVPPTKHSTILLNRPKALHALTVHMYTALYNRVHHVERATDLESIILTSQGTPGRAFCAGGDVRSMYHEKGMTAAHQAGIDAFFRAAYRADSLLGNLRRVSVLPVLDGIVMGGGAGLIMHGAFRLATENTVFAMPECALGLHPDAGALVLFSRLPHPGLGAYLALTGARLKGREVVHAGIATHFVAADRVPTLLRDVRQSKVQGLDGIRMVLGRHCEPVHVGNGEFGDHSSPLIAGLDVMQSCFIHSTVEEIESALQSAMYMGEQAGDREFAKQALGMLRAGSPTCVKVTLRAIQKAKDMQDLNECLKMDFRLIARLSRRRDFQAGVRAALITKDRDPQWEPKNFHDVSDDAVSAFFKPLSADLGIPELDTDHEKENNVRDFWRSRL